MRVSVLKTETFGSQSQLSRPRLSEVSLSFETETETGKLLMFETETRIQTIFETETTQERPLGVETEAVSLLISVSKGLKVIDKIEQNLEDKSYQSSLSF